LRKHLAIAVLSIGVAACGSVADLEPKAGQSLPPKPALARKALTAEDLLKLPQIARPKRVDELTKRGEVREADRFDLPPPDGEAMPVEGGSEPATASTTGPDNQDEPR
jgi:hypothetical protein